MIRLIRWFLQPALDTAFSRGYTRGYQDGTEDTYDRVAHLTHTTPEEQP